MEVSSKANVPAAGIVWQPREGAWVATVVAKLTFVLEPGACRLAPNQAPVTREDQHFDDDPSRSLQEASDLAPVKPRVDVVVVGSTHAPGRRPVWSQIARLVVGDVTKAIEVHGDRLAGPDGTLRQSAPFVTMPLAYERAGGGPGTSNPVGMRASARRPDGLVALPNLQRPGATPFEPTGFGAVARDWPERRERAGADGSAPLPNDRGPFTERLDLAFFNAAPLDQQLRAIAAGDRLVLDNLHPEHANLTTTIPSLSPTAVAHRGNGSTQPLSLRADTLVIDADRGTCAITFRGSFGIESASEGVRVVVSLEGEPRAPSVKHRATFDLDGTTDIPLHFRAGIVGLPFVGPLPPATPAVAEAPIEVSPWIRSTPPVGVPQPARSGAGALEASNAAAEQVAPAPTNTPAPTPAVGVAPAARHQPSEPSDACDLVWFDPELPPRLRKRAEYRALLDAMEERPADEELDELVAARDPAQIEDRRDVFEVLARGSIVEIAELSDAHRRCIREDGKFVPGLVLIAAELETPLDEFAELQATVGIAAPFANGDDTLREAVVAAQELLRSPGGPPPAPLAASFTSRIIDALGRGKRPGTDLEAQRDAALLEQRRYQRRAVFGKKHIRCLLVAGKPRPGGTPAPHVPLYLPDDLAEALPLVERFRARLLAEIRLAVSPRDGHPFVLRGLALAHVVSAERRAT